MFKFIAINSIAATVIVALSSALVIVLVSMAPEAKAEILPAPLLQLGVVATAPACSLKGWPHYEPHCHFDLRTGSAEPRPVRVIAIR